MPHYFFDTGDGDIERDTEGVDLSDDVTAREEAVRYLGAILSDAPRHLAPDGIFRVSVRSASGEVIAAIVTRDLSRTR